MSDTCWTVTSWNVNGLRAAAGKGFPEWLHGLGPGPHVIGLQEVRAHPDQVPPAVARPDGFVTHFFPANRPGYSGVALYATRTPDSVGTTLGVPEFDVEGRVQLARFGRLLVANVYFPNGNGQDRDNSRVPFKLAFYRRLLEVMDAARQDGLRVLCVGDYNTAHREIDLARPKDNVKTSGFLPEERAELDRWVASGWVDTFRHLHPTARDRYSWWSQRFGVRAKNIGWRLDCVFAAPEALPYVRSAGIHSDVMGSDHCPVNVTVDAAITD